MRGITVGALVLGVVLVAVSGCSKGGGPGNLPPPPGFGEPDQIQPLDEPVYSSTDSDEGEGEASEGDEGDDVEQPKRGGEPTFTDGMSVQEAITAAEGTERLNIDQDALGAPLARPELYEPCKLTPGDHFDLKVAVWNGRAVGIDVDAKNEKLRACLIEQIKTIRWKDKAKSLNTVEYSM